MTTRKQYIWVIAAFVVFVLIATRPGVFIPLILVLFFFFSKPIAELIKKYKNKYKNIKTINMTDRKIQINKKIIWGIVIAVIALALIAKMIVVVPAGYTGVYHLFGKVGDKELRSGIHLINPFAQATLMSVRTEQYTMSIAPKEGQRLGDDSIDALTKEGLSIKLDITILYHLIEEKASDVYRDLGTYYHEKIVRPETRSSIREVVALYEAKDIYSEQRDEAVAEILKRLKTNINPRGIEVESVLLRNVILPPMLTTAIENKLTAEQEAQRYDFVLEREKKEAERKRIEAVGQRDAQKTINESLTQNYLQYLFIKELKDRQGTIYVPSDLQLFKGL